jgi:hypothetical protein
MKGERCIIQYDGADFLTAITLAYARYIDPTFPSEFELRIGNEIYTIDELKILWKVNNIAEKIA